MANHGKHYSSNRSRRTARKVQNATVGTHVRRDAIDNRSSSSVQGASYVDGRYGARASQNQVETLIPITESGEDSSAYRRRGQQDRYLETVRKRARRRRILTFLIVAIIVIGLAVGAGFLAFRGVIGSHMALTNSDARDALSAPAESEARYTLFSVELGATAVSLEQSGPDMIVLLREDREKGSSQLIAIPAALKVTVDNDTRRLADMAAEGDASLIKAVETYTKYDINHFVKVDEEGIVAAVDALGGIEVTFDQILDDPNAGDVYYPIGTYTLNGHGALTYLRANNIRYGKTEQLTNQVNFLKLFIGQLMAYEKGFASGIEAIDSYFQTDLSLGELEEFASWLDEVGLATMSCHVVPGYFTALTDVVGDYGELYVSKSGEFSQMLEEIVGSDSEEGNSAERVNVEHDSFTVEVRNGTDLAGAASATSEMLQEQGFDVLRVGNTSQQVYDETLVIYRTADTPNPRTANEGVEGAQLQFELNEQAQDGEYEDPYAQDEQVYEDSPEGTSSQNLNEEQQRTLGQARANEVIEAIGVGRTIEGDMYYAFDADVLLIIGYDYKPVT